MVDGSKLRFSILLLLITVAVLGFTSAATLNVGTGQTYTTIQSAITAATNDGDTIEVYSGTYNENLVITKNNLIVQEATGEIAIISSQASQWLIKINAENVIVDGFELIGNRNANWGIRTEKDNTIIRNNKITNVVTGIQTTSAPIGNNQILNNEISNAQVGISLQNDYNIVKNNTINVDGEGFGIASFNTTFEDNQITVGTNGYEARISSGAEPYFGSITDGINAVNEGDTVYVNAGIHNENLNINKAISVIGENKNAVINGGVIISSSDVTLENFTIHNPSGTYGVSISGIVSRSNIKIKNNIISNIGSLTSLTYSAKGIYIGDRSHTGIYDSITIEGNEISNIDAPITTYETGGRGAYGVHINHGGATGITNTNFKIINNKISDLEGLWAHGIGLEGNTPNAIVQGNEISNLVDHKTPSDAVDLFFEENPSANTVVINNNIFLSLTGFGLAVHPNLISAYPSLLINAQNNYWGSINPNFTNLIYGNVIYSPWYDETFTTKYFTVNPETGSAEYDEENVGGITITPSDENLETITIQIESLTETEVQNEDSVFGVTSIGKFVSIESSVPNENINEVEIRVYYNESELSILESKLRLYYYNATSLEWAPASTEAGKFGINLLENYVWAITNHLSDYGIFGDTEGPTIGIPVTIPEFVTCEYGTISNPILVRVPITDASGVDEARLNWRYGSVIYDYFMQPLGESESIWETLITIPLEYRQNGTLVEYNVYAEDNLGNERITGYDELFTYDCSAPTTSDSASISWTNEDVIVTLTCIDSISNCKETYYKINDGEFILYDDTPFILSETSTITYYSIDNAGNEEEPAISKTISIDKIVPTISDDYSYNGLWENTDQTITLIPGDLGGSEINEIRTCEGVGCVPTPILVSPYELVYTTNQDTIVRYQAFDLAGNPSEIGEFNIKIDKTTPTTTHDYIAGWHNSDFTITLTPSDDGLSPVITYHKIWEISESEPTTWTEGDSILMNTDGEYNIKYYSEDEAGNVEEESDILVVQLDKTTPVVTIENVPEEWINSSVDLSVLCEDDLSECDTASYLVKQFTELTDCSSADYSGATNTLTISSNEYVCARATDNAGNFGYSELTEILIDNENPFVNITNLNSGSNLIDTLILVNATDSLSGIEEVNFELRDSTTSEVFKSGLLVYSSVNEKYSAMLTNVLKDVPVGTYILRVKARDNAGRESTDEITLNAVQEILPIITSIVSNVPYGQNSTVEFNISLAIREGNAVRMKISDLTYGNYSYDPEQLNARLVYDGIEYPVRNDYIGDKIILPSTIAGASGVIVFKMDIPSYMTPGSYNAEYQFEITTE